MCLFRLVGKERKKRKEGGMIYAAISILDAVRAIRTMSGAGQQPAFPVPDGCSSWRMAFSDTKGHTNTSQGNWVDLGWRLFELALLPKNGAKCYGC